MISILMPTRGRVENVKRIVASVVDTVDDIKNVEFCLYVDDDDVEMHQLLEHTTDNIKVTYGKRITLSQCWNEAYKIASGDIILPCGDDVVFRTPGWDTMVINTFALYPDHIVFVYGDDLSPRGKYFGTHGFIHRRWVEVVGYVCPPYFSSDYTDAWVNSIADILNRRIFMPFIMEHMHFSLGKGVMDQNTIDRIKRAKHDNLDSIYSATWEKRVVDAMKLGTLMKKQGGTNG